MSEWYFNIHPVSHYLYSFSYAAATFTRTRRSDHTETKSCAYSHVNKKASVFFYLYKSIIYRLKCHLPPCAPCPWCFHGQFTVWCAVDQVLRKEQTTVFGTLRQIFLRSFWELPLVLQNWVVVIFPYLWCSPVPVCGVESVHTRGWTGLNKHCKTSSSAMCQ